MTINIQLAMCNIMCYRTVNNLQSSLKKTNIQGKIKHQTCITPWWR